jgi:pilus assembly protein CpaF
MNKRDEHESLSAKFRRKILEQIDLRRLRSTNSETAQEEVLALIRGSINSEVVPLSFAERESLVGEILDEIGFGPLEQLLQDHTVSEIVVRRFDRVYVERAGKIEHTDRSFNEPTA